MLERILYVSRVAPGTEIADVFDIARNSDGRNTQDDLSGALVFVDGWFVQVLEGPTPALCAAYARILKDPRHTQLSFRARESVSRRHFGEAGLMLRVGTSLNPTVLRRFDYRFGFSVEAFPAAHLLEFMVWACRPVADTLHSTAQTGPGLNGEPQSNNAVP